MTIVCTALMLMLLAFSDSAMASALSAARCFVEGVMPALAPMMILGKVLPDSTKSEHSIAKRYLRTVFFAFAAGSPASAQRAAQLWDGAAFSQRGRESLLCLTGVMSPMFFTGTISGWLGSREAGLKLLLAHWLGAAATAGLWYMLCRKEKTGKPAQTSAVPERVSLPAAIAQSAQSLLCVCGAMMAFSVAACLLKTALSIILPRWTAQHADVMAAVWAVMEIGGGAAEICAVWQKPHAALSALCGFGGLSILLQNMLFLEGRIRPLRLAGMRAVHALVSLTLAAIIPF